MNEDKIPKKSGQNPAQKVKPNIPPPLNIVPLANQIRPVLPVLQNLNYLPGQNFYHLQQRTPNNAFLAHPLPLTPVIHNQQNQSLVNSGTSQSYLPNLPNQVQNANLDALECPEQDLADISTINPFQITNIAKIPEFFITKCERLLVRKQLLRCRKRHCKDNFQTFSVNSLWHHLKISHAGDYLCQSCNHVFSGLSLIRRHYQMCVVGYKCAGCQKSFNKKSNLTRHHRSCQPYMVKSRQAYLMGQTTAASFGFSKGPARNITCSSALPILPLPAPRVSVPRPASNPNFQNSYRPVSCPIPSQFPLFNPISAPINLSKNLSFFPNGMVITPTNEPIKNENEAVMSTVATTQEIQNENDDVNMSDSEDSEIIIDSQITEDRIEQKSESSAGAKITHNLGPMVVSGTISAFHTSTLTPAQKSGPQATILPDLQIQNQLKNLKTELKIKAIQEQILNERSERKIAVKILEKRNKKLEKKLNNLEVDRDRLKIRNCVLRQKILKEGLEGRLVEGVSLRMGSIGTRTVSSSSLEAEISLSEGNTSSSTTSSIGSDSSSCSSMNQ